MIPRNLLLPKISLFAPVFGVSHLSKHKISKRHVPDTIHFVRGVYRSVALAAEMFKKSFASYVSLACTLDPSFYRISVSPPTCQLSHQNYFAYCFRAPNSIKTLLPATKLAVSMISPSLAFPLSFLSSVPSSLPRPLPLPSWHSPLILCFLFFANKPASSLARSRWRAPTPEPPKSPLAHRHHALSDLNSSIATPTTTFIPTLTIALVSSSLQNTLRHQSVTPSPQCIRFHQFSPHLPPDHSIFPKLTIRHQIRLISVARIPTPQFTLLFYTRPISLKPTQTTDIGRFLILQIMIPALTVSNTPRKCYCLT